MSFDSRQTVKYPQSIYENFKWCWTWIPLLCLCLIFGSGHSSSPISFHCHMRWKLKNNITNDSLAIFIVIVMLHSTFLASQIESVTSSHHFDQYFRNGKLLLLLLWLYFWFEAFVRNHLFHHWRKFQSKYMKNKKFE